MADIINRSPFVVDIDCKSKDSGLDRLRKQFAFKHQAAAVNYAAALVKSGHHQFAGHCVQGLLADERLQNEGVLMPCVATLMRRATVATAKRGPRR